MVNVPDKAYDLARTFEGLRLEPYRDAAGLWTVGYGRLLSRDKTKGLSDFPAITLEKAEEFLAQDLNRAALSVNRLCPVSLNENQYAALIDFTFNTGSGNLQASTLRKKINRLEFEEAGDEFLKWIWAGGVKLPGLVKRRRAERELWLE